MPKIESFEDLECWKAARTLVKDVYLMSNQGLLYKDYDTKSQLKRASLSIMNNIAEGFGRYSNKEFVKFLGYSKSSAFEVKSMLYVLLDVGYINQTKFEGMLTQVEKIKNQLLAFIKYINTKL